MITSPIICPLSQNFHFLGHPSVHCTYTPDFFSSKSLYNNPLIRIWVENLVCRFWPNLLIKREKGALSMIYFITWIYVFYSIHMLKVARELYTLINFHLFCRKVIKMTFLTLICLVRRLSVILIPTTRVSPAGAAATWPTPSSSASSSCAPS